MTSPSPRIALFTSLLFLLSLASGCGVDTAVTGAGSNQEISTGGSGGDKNNSATKNSSGDKDKGATTQQPNSSTGEEGSGGGGGAADAGSTDPSEPPPGSGTDNAGPGIDAGTTDKDPGGADAGGSSESDTGPAKTCNKTEPVVLYLSADDSNSMAGATVARGLIDQGQYAYKALRTYEFLNYYDFDYPAAKAGEVAVSAQMRKSDKDRYHLQIGVRAPDYSIDKRRRANLVLAVDASSSMNWGLPGHTGHDRAAAACFALAKSLDKDDLVSVIAWGSKVNVLLKSHKVTKTSDDKVIEACGKLKGVGTSNFSAGLSAAYELAQDDYDAKRINRVVMISDGGANVGEKDSELIAKAAKDGDKEAIYLVGVGVGDPWNYNDALMDTVTDAGKGAYIFVDDASEASAAFGGAFLRHVEIAARAVQVELTLPPTFEMDVFHGEQVSTNKEEVEPQHLAANDAMIFHQVLRTCAPDAVAKDATVAVKATWTDPTTGKDKTSTFEAKIADLIDADSPLLRKGDAVVAYAEALADVRKLKGKAAMERLDEAHAAVKEAMKKLAKDADLEEIADLLISYRAVFETGQANKYPKGGTGAGPIGGKCGDCGKLGASLEAMSCALELCDDKVLLEQSYSSPTGSKTKGTYAASAHFGDSANDLKPLVGNSYALMATGPALGTKHSVDQGGQAMADPYVKGGAKAFNAMEWKLRLKAPKGANGLRIRHVFFSQEYDEYVGSQFNDKFYMLIEAGSTNGGKPTVINYTDCREPDKHHDFVCSPGMQFCNPRQRYCYIAINTAASECCWLNGCPNGKAKTDISGTGFSCAEQKAKDSANTGSSTGWMTTEWPVEPGEEFFLTFHVHDVGDGIYDSEVILDGLEFVSSVTPGTWSNQVPL